MAFLNQEATYNWTSHEKSVILSMDALGHIFTGFCGTAINKIGGATSLNVITMLQAAVALAAPFMLNTHLYLFLANRLVAGFLEVRLLFFSRIRENPTTLHFNMYNCSGIMLHLRYRRIRPLGTIRRTGSISKLLFSWVFARSSDYLPLIRIYYSEFRLANLILHY